ncbi:hypothetical protein [Allokutzneria oryzae]|uniref:Uncharacterized protein n=1 Tax=Allokutzneria oryzae TaxID=1378989 RepID=A0ABV5ZVG7_9PSEU
MPSYKACSLAVPSAFTCLLTAYDDEGEEIGTADYQLRLICRIGPICSIEVT